MSVITTLNVFGDLNKKNLKCIDSIKIGKSYSFKFKKYLISTITMNCQTPKPGTGHCLDIGQHQRYRNTYNTL